MRLWQGLAAGPDPAPGLRHGGIAGRSDRPAAAEGLATRVDLARARAGKPPAGPGPSAAVIPLGTSRVTGLVTPLKARAGPFVTLSAAAPRAASTAAV